MAPAIKAFSMQLIFLPFLVLLALVAAAHGGVCRPEKIQTFNGATLLQLTNVQGTIFFTYNEDDLYGWPTLSRLFKTNGFPSGTVLVKDIFPGGNASLVELTEVNGTLFFVATDAAHGRELWKSDGTAAGTVLVKDIEPMGSSSPRYLTNVNGLLFFNATDATHGSELWKSDGTAAGTVLVKDRPGGSISPGYMTNVNGTLFFSGMADFSWEELWKSDGTDSGTVMVKDIYPGLFTSSYPQGLTAIGSLLFFSADDGTHGRELWRSNGTASGTEMVHDVGFSSLSSLPDNITQNGPTILFSATESGIGRELWISLLGYGARLVKNINPEVPYWADSNPDFLTECGGTVYFAATKSDDATERELWKTDGTEAGTVMVKNINPAPGASSNPTDLICMGGMVYFSANDGHDTELWVSDGTEAGTRMVKDLYPSGFSTPRNFVNANGTLYFTTHALGDELWKCEEEFPWELFLPAFIHRD